MSKICTLVIGPLVQLISLGKAANLVKELNSLFFNSPVTDDAISSNPVGVDATTCFSFCWNVNGIQQWNLEENVAVAELVLLFKPGFFIETDGLIGQK